MKKMIIKKIFKSGDFDINPDPNDWVLDDLEHMARVIIRKTRKHPVVSVNYVGIWHNNSPKCGSYMRFEVVLETKVPKTARKQNLDDIINQLVLEAI